jgi:NodT family efflux transporter outer membrane factor (OMF) lipoprotein
MLKFAAIKFITLYTVTLLLASALLSSCSLLPRSELKAPQVSLPQQWQGRTVTGTEVANREQWWKNFNDPLLEELIDKALRTNNDLAAATIKVRRAQLQSGLTDTNLTPSVSISAGSGLNQDLNHGTVTQAHNVTASLSYELDLWGRLASLREADRWEAKATEVDRQNTALILIGTTAAAYWQVAYLNQRITSSEASLAYVEKTLELVRGKYEAGAVSGIDLAQARQAVATQQANLTRLLQQRTEARNALAILFDQPPQNSVPERQQLPDGPLPAIEAGLPASLLGRRPDLRAAELRLREYLANVDATRAGFYPTFTLTGTLGGSSISLENVLRNPVATLGLGLTLPFVQWNTAQLTIKVSETHYEEAVVNFRQTLYQALGDVENALSANAHYQAESVYLEQALAFSRQAERLAETRFRAGATGVQVWLDEQERRRTAEAELYGNRLNRLNNLMKLYQALGGDMRTSALERISVASQATSIADKKGN